MNLTVIIILSLVLLASYYYLLKSSVFGVNYSSGSYLGFFIFYQLIIFIIPSSILLNALPIENFWVAFKVKQESVFYITLLVIYSVFVFVFILYLISKINKKYFYNSITTNSPPLKSKNIIRFVRLILFICFLLMAISWFIFDVGHSFTLSFLTEESISIIRLSQTHNFIVKFTKHLFIFIVPLTAAILGSLAYKGHGLERIISILLIIFMASWAGNKGPIIMIFLVLFVSYATFANKKINIKTSISILIFIPLLLFLIYKIVLFQYSSMTDPFKFLDYFYQRVFIAQMIGVYEEFNLFISDPSYLWHGIPFASFLVEFPQFHKDLMMISEDRFDSASIGIKNTLFIAEAYGMGGIFLLIFSPIIMAVNFALTYIWMVIITNKMVIKNLDFTKKIIAISLFSYIGITGGFSDLMLFKITMLITLLILPFLFFHYFFLRSKH